MLTRRRLALLGVTALIAGLGVLAPQPRVVLAEEAVVTSETVELGEATDPGAVGPAGGAEPSAPAEEGRPEVRREVEPFDALGVTL
ncbi:MAG: hypothetical protein ACO1PW_08245 [Actinomycetota bacterium]